MPMRNNDLSKKLSEQTCSNARLEGEKAQLEQAGQKLKEEHVQLQQIVKDMKEEWQTERATHKRHLKLLRCDFGKVVGSRPQHEIWESHLEDCAPPGHTDAR